MDPNADGNNRLLHEMALYAIYVGIVGILMQSVVQLCDSNTKNKMLIGISLAALLTNFLASLSVFSPTRGVPWKNMIFRIIFEFTGLLCPYLAFYVLLPQWVTWHGFGILCMVLVFVKCYNMLGFMFTWSYRKVTISVKFIGNKFLDLSMRRDLWSAEVDHV